MVLESLAVPERMCCRPSRMIIVGFIYTTVGLFLAYTVFNAYASISSVFLTAMPLIVLMYKTLRYEECKECTIEREFVILREHTHVFLLFIMLFIGLVAGFSFWYIMLPAEISSQVSQTQMTAIKAVRAEVGATGNLVSDSALIERILENNLKVWGFCILFSFLYGAGAIFILTWNASVLAAAFSQYMSLHYFIHGIPEILAYFIAALAGGIISVAVANHDFETKEFRKILIDSLDLIILSIVVLLAAAYIEVYQIEFYDWFASLLI